MKKSRTCFKKPLVVPYVQVEYLMGLCELCPMGPNARTCGTRGDPEARVVLVGEAPGRDELREGIPFIGKAGQLLDKALREAGLETGSHGDGLFVTNACRCIPSKEKLIQACKACHGLLDAELKDREHTLLVLLGNSAIRSVMDNYAVHITAQRGKIMETKYGPALLTYHPAFCFRQPGQYKILVEDLKYAVSIIQGGEVKSPGQVSFEVANAGNMAELLAKLKQYPVLACDIETSERNPRKDRILCVGFSGKKNEVVIVPEHMLRYTKGLFESDTKFVWHNGKFDTAFLDTYGFDVRIDEDTMLQSYALNEAGIHGLKPLAAQILGATNWAEKLKKWLDEENPDWSSIPEDTMYDYLAQDADNTLQLHHIFNERLADPAEAGPRYAYQKVMIPAANFLRDVEKHGAYIDVERVEELRQILLGTTDDLRGQLRDYMCLPKFNPNSPKQVLAALNKCGIRVKKTDKPTIEPYASRSRFVRLLLAYRADKKQLGTYVEGVLRRMDDNQRVHSTFTIHVTVNGRLSSKQPNMQNMPAGPKGKRIKRIFGAPPGRCIIELDYSQAELRWLAVLSRDPWLRQVYLDGRDLHDEMSMELFGSGFTSEQRRLVKTINFGIPYGRQAPAIVAAVNAELARLDPPPEPITLERGIEIVEGWKMRVPEAWAFLRRCRNAVTKRGYVMSVYGRKRRFPMVSQETLDEMQNQASNHPISSAASDLTLTSSITMTPWLAERDAFIFNLVHDSTMIEAPMELAMDIAYHCKRIMEQQPIISFKDTLGLDIPFVADVKIGSHWGDAVAVDEEHIEGILASLPPQRYSPDYRNRWWEGAATRMAVRSTST